MLLSIITINLNNAVGLKKTIDSVLVQDYSDFEYIIIDGASHDGSVSVIQDSLLDYQINNNVIRFSDIHWISEPDSGIYNAMNKGIQMAKGNYLLFLNSGDYLVDSSVLSKVFLHCPSADILCARCRVSNQGKSVWISELVPPKITLGTLYWKGIMHQSTFIKKSLLVALGLYDESCRWLADVHFWYKAIIYNDASTMPIDVITSDYNLDGLSSTMKTNPSFQEEDKWQYFQPVLRNILPDYDEWKKDRDVVAEYGWINQRKHLRLVLKQYRKIVRRYNKWIKKNEKGNCKY